MTNNNLGVCNYPEDKTKAKNPPRRFGEVGSKIKKGMPAVCSILFVLIVWEVAVRLTGVSADILPSPIRVVRMLFINRALFWTHILPTLKETMIGLGATILAAVILAVLCDFFPTVRRFVYPILVISQTVPIIVIAPLFVIWFGYGLFPKIVIIIIVTFFSIAVALTDGFDSTEPEVVSLLKSMGATKWQQFYYVRLPAALPSFFTGLRIAITWSITAAIYGEYVGAEKGLGIFMQICKNDFRTDLVLGSVLIISALSLILFGVVALLRKLIIPWHSTAKAGEKQ